MLPQLAVSLFMAILFLQSGLDKVLHYQGNLAYFRDHFKKSPLAGMVSMMMPLITLLEVSAGALSAAGAVQMLLSGAHTLAFYGQAVAAAALLCLFFGQRLAQDYGGAATLVPYFLTALAGMWLTSGI